LVRENCHDVRLLGDGWQGFACNLKRGDRQCTRAYRGDGELLPPGEALAAGLLVAFKDLGLYGSLCRSTLFHVLQALPERTEAATHTWAVGCRSLVNDNGFTFVIGATVGQERFEGWGDFNLVTYACFPLGAPFLRDRCATALAGDFVLDVVCFLALAAMARSSEPAQVFKVLMAPAISGSLPFISVRRSDKRRAREANSGQVATSCGGPF